MYLSIADYRHVQLQCARYPLRGTLVSVQLVSRFDSIQVHGIRNLSIETLELYFENNRRSGGGEIKAIKEHREQDCALIQFKDFKSKYDKTITRAA